MAAIDQRNPADPASPPKPRLWAWAIAALGVGLALTALVAALVAGLETARRAQALDIDAMMARRDLQQRLERRVDRLGVLGVLGASDGAGPLFETVAVSAFSGLPDFRAALWVPRPLNEENWTATGRAVTGAGPARDVEPADLRDWAQGIDWLRKNGAAAGIIDTPPGSDRPVLALLYPVYRDNDPTSPPATRWPGLLGVAVGIFDLEHIADLSTQIAGMHGNWVDIRIDGQAVFADRRRRDAAAIEVFDLGGVRWTVGVGALGRGPVGDRSAVVGIAGLGGALSILLAVLVAVARRRAVESARLDRAVALNNRRLQAEIGVRKMAERTARDNERRMRAFAQAASDWFWEMDGALRFTYVSDRLCGLLGRDPGRLIGLRLRDIASLPEDAAAARRAETKLAGRMAFRDLDIRLTDKTGQARHLRLSGLPVTDEGGDFLGYRGSGTDVTALRRSERDAEEKHRLLETTLANIIQGVAVFNTHRRLVAWNDRLRRLVGGRHDWITAGMTIERFAQSLAERAEDAGGLLVKEIEASLGRIAAGGAWTRELDFRHGGAVAIHMTPLPDGGFVLTLTDIRERRRSEEKIRSLARFPEENPAPILRVGVDGEILYANEASAPLLMSWNTSLGGELPTAQQELVDRALADGESRETEAAVGPLFFSLLLAPVPEDGFVHIYGRDVTARHEAERQLTEAKQRAEAANQAKTDFLATVSHEIRTPLNGILGMTELLQRSGLNDRQRAYSQTIRESGEALLTVLNDILDFSKMEAGKLALEHIAFDLHGVMEGVLDLLEVRARQKGIALAGCFDPALPRRMLGDPGRLRQILLNLAGNGIKFTERGGVALKAVHIRKDDGRRWVRFEAHDSGIGIPPALRASLFEEFTQADASIARRYGGTGLGLAICKRLVAQMGGQIGVDSNEGQGSRFWFQLPLMVPADQQIDRPLPTLGGLEVVLIEGDGFLRAWESRQLADWGVSVIAAAGAQDAWAALGRPVTEGRRRAVVVSDAVADLAPLELAAEIRDLPGVRGARLVLLGYRSASEAAAATAAGYDAVVARPVVESRLYAALAAAAGQPVPATLRRIPAGDPIDDPGTRPLRILAAEDNQTNREVLIDLLKQAGHHIQAVDNGQRALAAVRQEDFDLILMDVQMPALDGLEATRRIRALRGKNAYVPIIGLSANVQPTDRQRCFAAGMDDFLEKPFDAATLLARVARYGGGAPAPAQVASAAPIPSRTTPPDRLPVLDQAVLDGMARMLGVDRVQFYVSRFLQESALLGQSCRRALAAGDGDTVGEVAHKIKGMSGSLGLKRLARRAEIVEAASRDEPSTALAARVEALMADLDAARARLSDGRPEVQVKL